MKDRIQYNADGKTIDEIVMGKASVHLEQLDDNVYMLIVENKRHHWHLRIGAKRAKVDVWMYEDFDKATKEYLV